jgi:hypothetical protein
MQKKYGYYFSKMINNPKMTPVGFGRLQSLIEITSGAGAIPAPEAYTFISLNV